MPVIRLLEMMRDDKLRQLRERMVEIYGTYGSGRGRKRGGGGGWSLPDVPLSQIGIPDTFKREDYKNLEYFINHTFEKERKKAVKSFKDGTIYTGSAPTFKDKKIEGFALTFAMDELRGMRDKLLNDLEIKNQQLYPTTETYTANPLHQPLIP